MKVHDVTIFTPEQFFSLITENAEFVDLHWLYMGKNWRMFSGLPGDGAIAVPEQIVY